MKELHTYKFEHKSFFLFEIVIEEVLWSIRDLIRQYEVSLAQMLKDIL